MTTPSTLPARLRVAHLNPRAPNEFSVQPDADARKGIAEVLQIDDVTRLAFSGTIRAAQGDAWELQGKLTARVVQPCVVTLAPVRSDLAQEVRRVFSPHVTAPEGLEVEMPDDSLEPLGQFIDLAAIMTEELALALPEYPRSAAAERAGAGGDREDAAPDADTRRPFANLDRLLKPRPDDGG